MESRQAALEISKHLLCIFAQLAVIYQACDGPLVRRAMFSATFTRDVEEWCKLNLDNVVQVYIGAKYVQLM